GNDVIVSFNAEKTIRAGHKQTYYLKADVAAAGTGESIQTRLSTEDESDPVTLIDGLTCTLSDFTSNANTGRLSDTAGIGCALFYGGTSQFVNTDLPAPGSRDIIWSDNSNSSDIPPTFTIVAGTSV
ncbi:unnamed protein product, partial [marine sediment metagenome]